MACDEVIMCLFSLFRVRWVGCKREGPERRPRTIYVLSECACVFCCVFFRARQGRQEGGKKVASGLHFGRGVRGRARGGDEAGAGHGFS